MFNISDQSNRRITWPPNWTAGIKPQGYLGLHEKICECGKYIAQTMAGICMNCEREDVKPFFNEK